MGPGSTSQSGFLAGEGQKLESEGYSAEDAVSPLQTVLQDFAGRGQDKRVAEKKGLCVVVLCEAVGLGKEEEKEGRRI